jgi:hypothetical protein
MSKEAREYLHLQKKLATLKYAEAWGNVTRACRTFCVTRASYYRWKKIYDAEGEAGLRRKKPIARNHPNRIAEITIERILHLRTEYHLGPQRIVWYMERYHGTRVSFGSVYRILVRNGLNRLPREAGRRAIHTRRYSKRVPGHHIQLDVKFLNLQTEAGSLVRLISVKFLFRSATIIIPVFSGLFCDV